MKTCARVFACLAVSGFLAFGALAQGDKPPSIKDVMDKLNKGQGMTITLTKEVNAANPNWDQIHKDAVEYVKLVDALARNTPPKGDKASWEKLAKEYATHARQMEAAAKGKNKDAVLAARKTILDSCKTCHEAHKNN